MQLSSKRAVTIMTALASLDLMIGTGQLKVTSHMISEAYIPAVQDWASFLAVILTTAAAVITGGSWATDTSGNPTTTSAMPKAVAAAVMALAIGVMLMAGGGTANAQSALQKAAIRNDVNAPGGPAAAVGPIKLLTPSDLLAKLVEVNLNDLKYAKAQAKLANNTVTLPCWSAWVDLISKSQQPVNDDDGKPLTKPDPHLFTDLEGASELLQAIQPGGSIQVGCGPMADATKKSIMQIASAIVSGGGLASLLPLPIMPPL